jgi:putative restriction endonuclease
VSEEHDAHVRLEVFDFLRQRSALNTAGLVHWDDLENFRLSDGERLVLIGQSGIWKPRQLRFPISVSTTPPQPGRPPPYEDHVRDDGTIVYRYRRGDPGHRDNVALRTLMVQRLPIVYFKGIETGWYFPHFPTLVIGDDPSTMSVLLDLQSAGTLGLAAGEPVEEANRRYAVRAVRQRLHQARFSSLVLHAYRCRCAVCSLAKRPLLDAAHIVRDIDPDGIAAAKNGLSLCKIHHAAYDQNLLGVDPDLRIHIARDLLEEIDGPMLQHGLKDMDGLSLRVLPARKSERPDPDRLSRRFDEFRQAQ